MIGGAHRRGVGWRYRRGGAPFGLAGWQAAYLAVGAPGMLLALLVVATVREPVRGAMDGQPHPGHPHPFRAAFGELAAMIPPFARRAAPLRRRRRAVAATCAARRLHRRGGADGRAHRSRCSSPRQARGDRLGRRHRDHHQHGAVGARSRSASMRREAGCSSIALRDPVAARLMIGTPSFVALAVGGGAAQLRQLCARRLHLPLRQDLSRADRGRRLHPRRDLRGGGRPRHDARRADRRCVAQARIRPGRVHVAVAAAILSGLFSLVAIYHRRA